MATIAVVMIDGVADWEYGTVLAAAHGWFGDLVQVASIDGERVTSVGGVRIQPAAALADLAPAAADLWLLPGSDRWRDGGIPALTDALRARAAAGKAIAAICAGTLALGHAGLLDRHAHTSNSLQFLRDHLPGYAGAAHYRDAPVASDGGIVTAPGTSPVGFACACLQLLHPDREQDIAHVRTMFAAEFADRAGA
jgi:putative intracellular protease/amidase